jgi:hypothetical protein
MPVINPYGGYLDNGAMSGAGANPYGGFLSMIQKQRGAKEQQTMADALTQLRKMIASMPGAPTRPLPETQPPPLPTADVYSPDDYEKGVTGIESDGTPNPYTAINPASGAGGKYQFMEPTWQSLAKDPTLGLTPEGRTSDTPDGRRRQQTAFRTLTQQNATLLKNVLGRAPTHSELFLAHFLGPSYASAVLNNRETPVKALVPDSFVEANPLLDGIDGNALLQRFGSRFNR